MVSLLYLVYSSVGLDVSSMFIRFFRYRTRTMMSSGIYNYQNTYCFSFSLDLLYWSLASLWLSIVPKTTPKPSTSTLKFQIDDVYFGRLKHPPHPPHPWWPLLPTHLHCPRPWYQVLVLYSLVVSWTRVVVVSPPPSLLTVSDGSISVSGVVTFYF